MDVSPYKSFALPGSKPQYNPDKPGLVHHIALTLTLDIAAERLTGRCTIHLTCLVDGLLTLTLDAVALMIKAVYLGCEPLSFQYNGNQIQLQLPSGITAGQTLEIGIDYQVEKPQRGIYFIKPDEHYPHKPVQVWTQGEDEDSRFWFPCFDYPGQLATSEIRITIPKPYRAISNGVLVEEQELESYRIFHWRQEQVHPTYLMTLAVGEFTQIDDGWDGIATPYYVTPGREEEAQRTLGKTPRMVAFFSEAFGVRYPFPRYAQVCVDDFIFGGMENTSCTLLTDRCLLDEIAGKEYRWSEDLVSHELIHQWFGDLVVIKHWSHAWIKEGAASYFEVLWREHEYGAEDGDYFRYQDTQSYFSEDSDRYRRPIVTNIYKEAIELYDRHLYQKGATVYHMLRYYLGEKLFFASIKTFLEDNRHQTVETIDLLRAIEKTTGRNFLPLFEQYVFKGGHPDFKVGYAWDEMGNYAQVTVEQTQTVNDLTVLFDLKVPIVFGYADHGSQTFLLHLHQKTQTFCFPLTKKPLYFAFDPSYHILKTVELEVAVEDLKAQLRHDPTVMGRVMAIQALAKKANPNVVESLREILQDGSVFWGVRSEVAAALGKAKREYAFSALRQMLISVEHPIESLNVLKAVINALGEDPSLATVEAVLPYLKHESYFVSGAAARTLGKTKHSEAFRPLRKTLRRRDSCNETVRIAVLDGLANFKDTSEVRDLLIEQTELGVPQPLRLGAIRALGRWGEGQKDRKVLARLAEIAKESFFLTRLATISALEALKSPEALALLQEIAHNDPDGRVERVALEAIENLRAAVSQGEEIKKLRETLEDVQKTNQELKGRLEVLEAKTTHSPTLAQ